MNSKTRERTTPDPKALLLSYLQGRNREQSFTRLVTHYAPLIYSSAFRRCSNHALAEDITQNVLTLIARKAPSLSKHPNLTAWVFQTTRLETGTLMRTERRRQHKHNNYHQDPSFLKDSKLPPEQQTTWQSLLPHLDQALDQLPDRDRELILKRFFENQKFKDIAHSLKSTEGACKMQLKRALERLSSSLSSQGSSLPTTAIGTGLLTSLAATSPSKAATTLASQALSGSTTVSTSSTLTNTILTMTNTQKIVTLGLLLITITSIPAVQMARESSRLQNQIHILESRSLELTQKSTSQPSYQIPRNSRQTVKSLLASQSQHLDAHTFLEQLSKAIHGMDIMDMIRVFLPLSEMNSEELDQLLADLQAIEEYPENRLMALQMVAELSTEKSQSPPREALENYLSQGLQISQFGEAIRKWASRNPQEALAWFLEKDQAGLLSGKGAIDQSHHVLGFLLEGIAQTSLQQAFQIYSQGDHERRATTASTIVYQILERYQISRDLSEFNELLKLESDESIRYQIFQRATQSVTTLPEIIEILSLQKDSSAFPFSYHLARAITVQSWPFEEKAASLQEELSPSEFQKTFPTLMKNSEHTEVVAWIQNQSPGELPDPTLSEYSILLARSESNFQTAYEIAQGIKEEKVQSSTFITIAEAWNQKDPQAAKQHLPSHILEKIRP